MYIFCPPILISDRDFFKANPKYLNTKLIQIKKNFQTTKKEGPVAVHTSATELFLYIYELSLALQLLFSIRNTEALECGLALMSVVSIVVSGRAARCRYQMLPTAGELHLPAVGRLCVSCNRIGYAPSSSTSSR